MGWGDEVLAAGEAQRLFDTEPGPRVAIIDQRGKVRWHPIWQGNPILATPEDVARGEPVRKLMNAPGARPYIVYPFTEETGWTFNKSFRCRDHIAKIYLTPAEEAIGSATLDAFGPYVLIEPFTKHVNFRWPMERWAAVVDACPDLQFVQHVHSDSALLPGVRAVHATFREACGLARWSSLYVRSESGMCHAAAALEARQVTLFGGCMDPDVMAFYPGQTVLADRRPKSPCGSWRRCPHCVEAMNRITVDDVALAIRVRLTVH